MPVVLRWSVPSTWYPQVDKLPRNFEYKQLQTTQDSRARWTRMPEYLRMPISSSKYQFSTLWFSRKQIWGAGQKTPPVLSGQATQVPLGRPDLLLNLRKCQIFLFCGSPKHGLHIILIIQHHLLGDLSHGAQPIFDHQPMCTILGAGQSIAFVPS